MTTITTAEELYAKLGLPQCPSIVDVRRPPAVEANPRMIASATRGTPDDIANWARHLQKSKPVVVYCVHGHEVGKNAAETLTALGYQASYLENGIEEWIATGLPTIACRPEFGIDGRDGMQSRWVTRARPKIDRLACPWLVRRFIDSNARFFYVPAADVRSQVDALRAQAYDIPDTRFSHRGPLCSFDAFLVEFDLHDPALDALAKIVRAADTGDLQTALQAPGLLAISLGLCANIPDDDALLEAAMPIYDALYAWCKTASTETHNWPFANRG